MLFSVAGSNALRLVGRCVFGISLRFCLVLIGCWTWWAKISCQPVRTSIPMVRFAVEVALLTISSSPNGYGAEATKFQTGRRITQRVYFVPYFQAYQDVSLANQASRVLCCQSGSSGLRGYNFWK